MGWAQAKNRAAQHFKHLACWVKISADNLLKYFSYIFQENRPSHFIQVVSLLEISKPIFWGKNKKNVISWPSALLVQRVVKGNVFCNISYS